MGNYHSANSTQCVSQPAALQAAVNQNLQGEPVVPGISDHDGSNGGNEDSTSGTNTQPAVVEELEARNTPTTSQLLAPMEGFRQFMTVEDRAFFQWMGMTDENGPQFVKEQLAIGVLYDSFVVANQQRSEGAHHHSTGNENKSRTWPEMTGIVWSTDFGLYGVVADERMPTDPGAWDGTSGTSKANPIELTNDSQQVSGLPTQPRGIFSRPTTDELASESYCSKSQVSDSPYPSGECEEPDSRPSGLRWKVPLVPYNNGPQQEDNKETPSKGLIFMPERKRSASAVSSLAPSKRQKLDADGASSRHQFKTSNTLMSAISDRRADAERLGVIFSPKLRHAPRLANVDGDGQATIATSGQFPSFGRKDRLKRHIRTVHEKTILCRKGISQGYNAFQHYARAHHLFKSLRKKGECCKLCGEVFATKALASEHVEDENSDCHPSNYEITAERERGDEMEVLEETMGEEQEEEGELESENKDI
ncbi:hypothetical protein FRC17_009664 [Serendipita sp. 399]|nr:hypothetical protein FRC17_009664 [Serendipita sp. 399]